MERKLETRKSLTITSTLLALAILTQVSAPLSYAQVDPVGFVQEGTTWISENTDNRLNLSGYLNYHTMIHHGAPDLVGKQQLDEPLNQLREASLFADVLLSDSLLVSSEIELANSDSGVNNVDKLRINYLYLDVDISSLISNWQQDRLGSLSLRAGKMLVPFLSYNENKPSFKQFLMSPPFTAQQFAPVIATPISFSGFGWSDYGLQANWSRAIAEYGLFDFKFMVMNGLQQEDPAVLDQNTVTLNTGTMMTPTVRPRDGLLQNEADLDDNNDDKATSLKAAFRLPTLPLDFGFSWYRGDWDDSDSKSLNLYGFHLNLIEENWALKAEYGWGNVEQDGGINPVTQPGPGPINTSVENYDMVAWYVEGSLVPFRYGTDDSRFIRTIVRGDELDTNSKAPFTPFDRIRLTLGVEWEFLRNIRLRYEHQFIEIDNFQNAPPPYERAGGKEHIDMDMISIIVWF